MNKNWRNADDVRVCVYAICADEPADFIRRWLSSMRGADIICVLVTKLKNANYGDLISIAEELGMQEKIIVRQKQITPWRFDTARNESMKLIPQGDVDVCVCTDIDEMLDPEFWSDLRHMVYAHPDFERIYYKYAWNHDENGNDGRVLWYDKIHQPRGWSWQYPVHEMLVCPQMSELGYTGCYRLGEEKVYLHHFPDQTKSRGSYLPLLELRAKEDPEDSYGLYYLMREYQFYNRFDDSLQTAIKLYCREISQSKNEMGMLPNLAREIANMFARSGCDEEAEFFYKKALRFDPTLRSSYIDYAQFLAYRGRPNDAFAILHDAEKESVRQYDWREVDYDWTWRPLLVAADALCWLGRYSEAKARFEGIERDFLHTEKDRVEARACGFYDDWQWLKDRISISEDS